jgi:hypothetical protein
MATVAMLKRLAAAYTARDDVAFAQALIVSYREGNPWSILKQELSNVSSIHLSCLASLGPSFTENTACIQVTLTSGCDTLVL